MARFGNILIVTVVFFNISCSDDQPEQGSGSRKKPSEQSPLNNAHDSNEVNSSINGERSNSSVTVQFDLLAKMPRLKKIVEASPKASPKLSSKLSLTAREEKGVNNHYFIRARSLPKTGTEASETTVFLDLYYQGEPATRSKKLALSRNALLHGAFTIGLETIDDSNSFIQFYIDAIDNNGNTYSFSTLSQAQARVFVNAETTLLTEMTLATQAMALAPLAPSTLASLAAANAIFYNAVKTHTSLDLYHLISGTLLFAKQRLLTDPLLQTAVGTPLLQNTKQTAQFLSQLKAYQEQLITDKLLLQQRVAELIDDNDRDKIEVILAKPPVINTDVSPLKITPKQFQLATGEHHNCAIVDDGNVKCWGFNVRGQLGQQNTKSLSDHPLQTADKLVPVALGTGRKATQIAAGDAHTCVLLDDASVKCWGLNSKGQLGLGTSDNRGDSLSEMGDYLASVDLGNAAKAIQITAGSKHTCALLEDASVKCWGDNWAGQLGQGDGRNRGDLPDEMGGNLAPVKLGSTAKAKQVGAGGDYSCAVLEDGNVKCWGLNTAGQLGLGDFVNHGDNTGEMGNSLAAVDLGSTAKVLQIATGKGHICALLDDARVKCWGVGSRLGLGDSLSRGSIPDEMGDFLTAVNFGSAGKTTQIAAGDNHSCALFDDGRLKCWGLNDKGQLGLGDTILRGDSPSHMGNNLPFVDLGNTFKATQLSAGASHTCALATDANVKCWGMIVTADPNQDSAEERGDQLGEMGNVLKAVMFN